MDCHSSNLFFRTLSGCFSLLFLMLLSVPLQGAITISGSNPVPCGPADGYYLVDFTISGLHDLQANPDFYSNIEDRRYGIFFYFGDGTHVELIVDGDESSVSCQHIYQVEINSTAEFDLRAEITSIYLPTDPNVERVFSQTDIIEDTYNREFLGSGTVSCDACETEADAHHLNGRDFYATDIDPSEGRWVQRIRDAVPGDHFTLAIQYGFDICQIDQGLLVITYPESMFSPKWASSPSAEMSSTPGKIFFNFEYGPSEDVSDQRLYISFEVLSTAEVEQDYEFSFNRSYQGADACDGKATRNDIFVQFADRIKSGHDPNSKSVDPQFFVDAGPTSLKYLIRFYNEGNDPVDSIMIKDILDNQLEFTSISDIHFWTGMDPTKKTPSEIAGESTLDATFRWNVGALLPAGGLPPTKGKVAKKEEWAYLSFVVNTKAGIKAESCIPNSAEIFFYYTDGTERNFVEEVEACRTCCQREVAPNEEFRLGESDSSIIRIIDAPRSLQRNADGEFFFSDANFSQAQIQYQECRQAESGRWNCSPVSSIHICNSNNTNSLCSSPPPPPPSNTCIICWIILLLLIYALLIYLAYRLSPNP